MSNNLVAEAQARAILQAEQAAGRGAGTLAADASAKLALTTAPTAGPVVETALVAALHANMQTFVHQVAGATTIMPDGKVLVFNGKHGLASLHQVSGLGYYMTDIKEEIDWLLSLCKFPTSQVTQVVVDPVTAEEKVVVKRADPAIAQSVQDAARNTELVFNPQAAAAVENLSNSIAKDSVVQTGQ